MKRVLITCLILCAGLNAMHAEEYSYLTFELTDGTKASVTAASLTLTINGTTLTTGSQSFTLTNLLKMYFTTTDMSTGIKSIDNGELIIDNEIYDLQGHKVTKAQMKKGVYIVKTKEKTYKIVVK